LAGNSRNSKIGADVWDRLIRSHRTVLLVGLSVLSGWGLFHRFGMVSWPAGAWTLGWLFAVVSLAAVFLRAGSLGPTARIEAGLAAVLGIHALTQATGGLHSPWMLAYVFLLIMTGFSSGLRVNLVALGATIALEGIALLGWNGNWPQSALPAAVWCFGLILIPLTVKGYLRAWAREKDLLRERVSRMESSARTVVSTPDIHEREELHSLDSEERLNRLMPISRRFDEIVDNLLGILKNSLKRSERSLLFVVRRPDVETLRLHHCAGNDLGAVKADVVVTVGRGLIGWIAREQKPVCLGRLDTARDSFVEYLSDPGAIRSILAIPLFSEGNLEGVVAVDSREAEAFSEADENLLVLVARQILRALLDVRDRDRVENRAFEFSTLLGVSRALSSKLDLNHRLQTMADKVKQIIPYEQCFIFLVDEGERRARLAVVRGLDQAEAEGESIALRDGYVSLIVKNRHAVLFTDLKERKRRFQLFPTDCPIRISPASFMGLPMIVDDRVIGVFAITSDRADAFTGHHKDFLETLCHQAALSVSDAQLHDQVARLATTDGLTGIPNHRKFQERLVDEFERQNRQPGNFSLIMLDVDHFKQVNDTFGHPVGDQVLKRLAGILSRMVRKVDTVARYGGEEFSLLLHNAGKREALRLAERIRKTVEEARFEAGSSNGQHGGGHLPRGHPPPAGSSGAGRSGAVRGEKRRTQPRLHLSRNPIN
jgi:two-component system cell cycle response regulator